MPLATQAGPCVAGSFFLALGDLPKDLSPGQLQALRDSGDDGSDSVERTPLLFIPVQARQRPQAADGGGALVWTLSLEPGAGPFINPALCDRSCSEASALAGHWPRLPLRHWAAQALAPFVDASVSLDCEGRSRVSRGRIDPGDNLHASC